MTPRVQPRSSPAAAQAAAQAQAATPAAAPTIGATDPKPPADQAGADQPAGDYGHALTRWSIPIETASGPVVVSIDTDQRPNALNPGAVDAAIVAGHLAGLAGALLTRNWRAAGAAGFMLLNQAALYLSSARVGVSWKPAKPAPTSTPAPAPEPPADQKDVAKPAAGG